MEKNVENEMGTRVIQGYIGFILRLVLKVLGPFSGELGDTGVL